MAITSIDASDVNKITSGQVIIELQSVVKELVDNALDAGSTQLEVIFDNYGLKGVDVIDNGKGINDTDYDALCLKHHTSKLTSFEDLESVTTLGFRGEALASLCAVAKVRIITCTESTYPKAAQLEYDSMGNLRSHKSIVSGKKGTSVIVRDIFHDLPVRQKYFTKNAKREYSKALSLLVGYLLMYTDVRFAVYLISGNTGKKSMVMGTQGRGTSIFDTLVSVYGSNGAHGLVPISIATEDIEARFKLGMKNIPVSLRLRVTGLILDYSFGMGRGALDRQFLYVNKRPVVHKKFSKIINEVYKVFNHTQSPVFVLNIELDEGFVDVNITPDKRSVMVQNEDVLGEVLREELTKFYESMHNVVPKSQLGVVKLGSTQATLSTAVKRNFSKNDDESSIKQNSKRHQAVLTANSDSNESLKEAYLSDSSDGGKLHRESPSQMDKIIGSNKQDESFEESLIRDTAPGAISQENESGSGDEDSDDMKDTRLGDVESQDNSSTNCSPERQQIEISEEHESCEDHEDLNQNEVTDFLLTEEAQLFVEQEKEVDLQESNITQYGRTAIVTQDPDTDKNEDQREHNNYTCKDCRHHDKELLGDADDPDQENCTDTGPILGPADRQLTKPSSKKFSPESVSGMQKVLKMDLEDLKFVDSCLLKDNTASKIPKQPKTTLVNVHDVREKLVIQKLDFSMMEVIGQFNLGFIVVKHDDRLFIVDQHASDEIFNYERLHKLLLLRAQPLVIPRVLELSPIDEILVLDQQDQLRKNGFIVKEAADPHPGKRVELVALPVLKNVVFDESDLHELVQRLHETGPSQGSIVRCKKVDLMIALRACRLSIMVGQTLNKGTMNTVVSHLAELERPWNCPHGRPTMRHLADLEGLGFAEDYEL
uniref:DNA mismatch repair protein MutL n=1 Tax=Candidozyma auris TaxID=498019 RepID=A0A0L0NQH7_CANAR